MTRDYRNLLTSVACHNALSDRCPHIRFRAHGGYADRSISGLAHAKASARVVNVVTDCGVSNTCTGKHFL